MLCYLSQTGGQDSYLVSLSAPPGPMLLLKLMLEPRLEPVKSRHCVVWFLTVVTLLKVSSYVLIHLLSSLSITVLVNLKFMNLVDNIELLYDHSYYKI